jgi:hypothetical protein
MRRVGLLAVAWVTCACGGGPARDGSTTIAATGELAFIAVEARAATMTSTLTAADGSTSSFTKMAVIASSVNQVCSMMESSLGPPGSTTVVAGVQISGTSALPIVPGTYTIGSPDPASAYGRMEALFDRCTGLTLTTASAGTVKVLAIDADEVSGSLDLTMLGGTHVAGTFKARFQCPPDTMQKDLLCHP